MQSRDIVWDIRVLIQNELLPSVAPYWRTQLWFGLQTYGLRAFQSAAGNARQVVANAHTAARLSGCSKTRPHQPVGSRL